MVTYNDWKSKTGILLNRLYIKLSQTNKNRSDLLLGTDLLRDEIALDLFQIVFRVIEEKLIELSLNTNSLLDEIETRKILLGITKLSTENFLLKYYGLKFNVNIEKEILKNSYLQTLQDDSDVLIKVPFSLLLNIKSTKLRSSFLLFDDLEVERLCELLITNLVIEISNCVARIINSFLPSLNGEYNLYLYRSNFLSIRNIENFENSLAWQDRINKFFSRPQYLYNSEYKIWLIRNGQIYSDILYANRLREFLKLKDTALITITYIELRDFVLGQVRKPLFKVKIFIQSNLREFINQGSDLVKDSKKLSINKS